MTPDPRLDAHWRTVHRSKANPDLLTHAELYDSEKSKATGRAVWRSPIVKIIAVSIGLVKNKENPKGEEMVFLHFERTKKKLGLNTTNFRQVEKLTGVGAPNQWVGATIQLYVDPQAKYYGGDTGPAIRVSPKLPRSAADASPMPTVLDEDRERLEKEQSARLDREPGQEG